MDTVRRRLRASGKKCRRPAKKIFCHPHHKEARVSFCLEYYNFDWENNIVIFVDEKSFRSDRDGRKILWRNNNQRYVELNTLPNRASGRISINFWGWMSSMGPGELVEVDGRMNGEQYVELLRDVMVPTVRLHYPEAPIYLCQDNCRVHTSRVVEQWLASQNDVIRIPWPAKSPDLNPIENLWGLMVLDWDATEIRNNVNLRREANLTWERLRGSDTCWNMVTGMRDRLDAVLEAQGGPTRY